MCGTALTLLHNLLFYLGKVLYPIGLSAHYEVSHLRTCLQSGILVGAIASICLITCLVVSLRWTRALLTGWLVFVVMIFPTLGIVKVTDVDVANRYVYLPSIGIILTLAWALSRSTIIADRYIGQKCRVLICGGILVLAGGEGILTHRYSLCWRDSRSLYAHMLSMYPTSSVLHNNFATDLQAMGQLEEAIMHFRAAIDGDPNSFRAHYNLALALHDRDGPSDEVVQHYRTALMSRPSFVPGYVNLGGVLIRKGDLSDAEAALSKATEIDPHFGLAHYNLGNVLIFSGRPLDGVAALHEALRISPDSLLVIKGLAWLMATHPSAEVRDPNEAIRLAERALAMTGGRDVGVLDTLAAAYALEGSYKKAVETAEKARALATRVRNYELADQIQERLRLYQFECPYYEDPKVQLERLMAKAKKAEDGGPKTEDSERTTGDREPVTDDLQEVQDETETMQ
jgi:tetratricopeptide (TPR) repeat protein